MIVNRLSVRIWLDMATANGMKIIKSTGRSIIENEALASLLFSFRELKNLMTKKSKEGTKIK